MIEIEAKVKKWGTSSLGLIIPKEVVRKKNLKPNQTIKLLLEEDSNVLKETVGSLKGKIKESTQSIKDEIRSELYND